MILALDTRPSSANAVRTGGERPSGKRGRIDEETAVRGEPAARAAGGHGLGATARRVRSRLPRRDAEPVPRRGRRQGPGARAAGDRLSADAEFGAHAARYRGLADSD